jgi:hypothetical protein
LRYPSRPSGRRALRQEGFRTFVRVTLENSEREYAAFRSPIEAAKFMNEQGGGIVDWVEVQRVAVEATNYAHA